MDFFRSLSAGATFSSKTNPLHLLSKDRGLSAPKRAVAPPNVAPPAARKPRSDPTPPLATPDESGVALFGGTARPAPASAPTKATPAPGAPPKTVHLDPEEQEWRAFQHRLHIKVTGADAPRLWPTFDACPEVLTGDALATVSASGCCRGDAAATLARHAATRRAVLRSVEASRYSEPTAIQMQALPAMLQGRDVLGVAPTGSGKTAAFALPLILLLQGHVGGGPRALVLEPTKELAAQTAREVSRLAAGTGLVAGVLSRSSLAGVGSGGVSAARDAADLVRRRPAAGDKRRRRQRGGGGGGAGSDGEASSEGEEEEAGGAQEEEPPAPSNAPIEVVSPTLPGVDVLVTTPLLLVALLRHTAAAASAAAKRSGGGGGAPPQQQWRVRVVLATLRVLVADEVDKLLEESFLEQTDEIYAAARPDAATLEAWTAAAAAAAAEGAAPPRLPPPPPRPAQCAMFSATLPSGVEALAQGVLRDTLRVTVGAPGAAATTVAQRLVFVGREDGKLLALRQLIRDGFAPPALVFVQSKERAIELHKALALECSNAGGACSVGAVHADLSPAQREAALTAFRRGDVWLLVTTDLLARGMDFKGVRLVVNYDFPTSAVSYVHRVGRAGRAGREGAAMTLFTEDDIPALRSVANVMRLSGCEVPEWMLALKKKQRRGGGGGSSSGGPRRAPILRTPRFDERQAARKRDMVAGSKRRAAKAGAAAAASAGGNSG